MVDKRWFVVFGGLVAGVVFLTVDTAPDVDPKVRDELEPLIRTHLEDVPQDGTAAGPESVNVGFRVFCDVRVVEVRTVRTAGVTADFRVGVHATCEEYGVGDGALLSGMGWSSPLSVTVHGEPGSRRIVQTVRPEDGAGYAPSVDRMFSERGVSELGRVEKAKVPGSAERLKARAREAFGLPADAPVRPA